MTQALNDLRILDLSRILAGPYATMLLADYGAEVIKVEQPGSGDGTRQWGPPWVGEDSAYFQCANRNKKSITLNLKQEAGKEVLRRLVKTADILVENFKVGTMTRLGLGYDSLKQLNPRLIYCAITGFGQDGPSADLPGYDTMIQAQGGIMSITGAADGEPSKVGVAIADVTTALFASHAMLAALHHRERTGEGQLIDVALFDTQLSWLINVAHNYFATGETPGRYGNAHANLIPYQTFKTADGQIMLAIGSDAQFRRFCEGAGRPDLWEDGRFQNNAGRLANRVELEVKLGELMAGRKTAVWLDLLQQLGIPASPINDIPTALNHPQAVHRQMVQTVQHPVAGETQQLGPVAKLSATPPTIRAAPPLLGADNTAVLQELGYSEEEIAQLEKSKTI